MASSPTESSTQITKLSTRADESLVLEVRQAMLKVIKGPDKGLQLQIPHTGLVAGSASDNGLVLTDPAISRKHFDVKPADNGFRIRDLGSTNGTKVNGLQIKEATLVGGEDVIVGTTRIRLLVLDDRDEFPVSSKTSFGPLQGRSVAMRQVFAILERAVEVENTLLIEGESGTGKDAAAEAVHRYSARRDKPFVIVDCGAIQPSLVESELFGHRKGAFTGAESHRAGAFESANGGTVFLDEIGELDLKMQPMLLRVLETKSVRRVGENQYRPVDIRLIAATNKNLQAEVDSGRFREDLFFRISVLKVHMPALRDHREDIGQIARKIVQGLDPDADPLEVITDQVASLLFNYDWPGNVRELRNVIERMILFPNHPVAALDQRDVELGGEIRNLMKQPYHEARRAMVDRFEKAYLSSILDACDGMVTKAAKMAGIPRQTIHRLMTKHRMQKP